MQLSFKNKMLMAIEKLCEEGTVRGGIPKHITMSGKECRELLEEVSYLQEEKRLGRLKDRAEITSTVEIKSCNKMENLDDPNHPTFLINTFMQNRNVTKQTYDRLVEFWTRGEIRVTYNMAPHNVPLIHKEPPKKPKTTEWTK